MDHYENNVAAVNMVNGISVNGLGEVSMEASQNSSNLIGLGKFKLLIINNS